MATLRHQFIPFAFQEELAEQLASQTPVLASEESESFYRYDLPKSYDEVLDAVGRQMTEEMTKWAETNQTFITKRSLPRFFQLKQGAETETRVWTKTGEASLMVPLFKGTIDVLVCVRNSDAKYQIQWDCRSVLRLDEETGIRPLTGDIIFHYNVFLFGAAGQEG